MKTLKITTLEKMSCGSEHTSTQLGRERDLGAKKITIKKALELLSEELVEQSHMLQSFLTDCREDKDEQGNTFRIFNNPYEIDFFNWEEVQDIINNKIYNIADLTKNIKKLNKRVAND